MARTKVLNVDACRALRFELPEYVSRRKFLQAVFGCRGPVNYNVSQAVTYTNQGKVEENSRKVIDAIRSGKWPFLQVKP